MQESYKTRNHVFWQHYLLPKKKNITKIKQLLLNLMLMHKSRQKRQQKNWLKMLKDFVENTEK